MKARSWDWCIAPSPLDWLSPPPALIATSTAVVFTGSTEAVAGTFVRAAFAPLRAMLGS